MKDFGVGGVSKFTKFLTQGPASDLVGVRTVWTSFCIWLSSLVVFLFLLFVFVYFLASCSTFWHSLLVNIAVNLLEYFITT